MTDEVTFEIGDVVRLKSGGPRMTVTQVRGDSAIECSWYTSVDAGDLAVAVIHAAALVKPA